MYIPSTCPSSHTAQNIQAISGVEVFGVTHAPLTGTLNVVELTARREHHENFRRVSCETKATVISPEATTPAAMQRPIARHHKLLWEPVLNPAVTN